MVNYKRLDVLANTGHRAVQAEYLHYLQELVLRFW
jgi:hypothetical protein